ncbi:hypothetical protein DVH24_024694 [Malus domestica]|uniref:Uncharacterized protein n=1 Tax=Malus domestica TaxID=3750 RepID=A0A498JHG8_MALDO|nr:hypothetical protein DVH24_024694 [Malus domestica]
MTKEPISIFTHPTSHGFFIKKCTRLPLYAGSGRGECRLALPPFMEKLLPSFEPETYRSWAKAHGFFIHGKKNMEM